MSGRYGTGAGCPPLTRLIRTGCWYRKPKMEELELKQLLAAPQRLIRLEPDVAVLVVGEITQRLRQLRLVVGIALLRQIAGDLLDILEPELRRRRGRSGLSRRLGLRRRGLLRQQGACRQQPGCAGAGSGDQEPAAVETRQRTIGIRAGRYVVHGPSEPMAVPVDRHDPSELDAAPVAGFPASNTQRRHLVPDHVTKKDCSGLWRP